MTDPQHQPPALGPVGLRRAALSHRMAIQRRRQQAEREIRVRAWFTGFCWGVFAAMAMLVGVTYLHCAVTLGGAC